MMKMGRAARTKKIAWVLIVAIVMSYVPVPVGDRVALADGEFAGGAGVDGNPYTIETPEQLDNVRNYLTSYFLLLNDIDLTEYLSETGAGWNEGAGWEPIGSNSSAAARFRGVFDGGGHAVTGLRVDRQSTDDIGFFGYTGGAAIRNVQIPGVNVKGHSNVGGLVGTALWTSIIQCGTSGTVIGTAEFGTGGIVGYLETSSIVRSYSTANVTAAHHAGGLIGRSIESSITDCYATGTVTAVHSQGQYAGGLIGMNSAPRPDPGPITNCYATGVVTGVRSSGGLVGQIGANCPITASYYCETTGQSGGVGDRKTVLEMKEQETFDGWDFAPGTGAWRILDGYTYPVLSWQSTTHAEIDGFISMDLDEIEIGYAPGDSASSVRENLTLPTSGSHGTTISWISDTPSVVANDGRITRPFFNDHTVTLTASVSRAGGVSQNRDFEVTVMKVDKNSGPEAPPAPELQSTTHNSVTLIPNEDHEFRVNGGNWQTSNVFDLLFISTSYSFTARVKETETEYASEESDPLNVITADGPEMDGTVIISGDAKFGATLTADVSGIVYAPDVDDDTPAYTWNRNGLPIDGANASSYVLGAADVGQVITVTLIADGIHATGRVTSDPTVTVDKADGPSAPGLPVLAIKTESSVTLQANADHEFRANGGDWQDSNVFTGLSTNTEYVFTARVRETTTHKASAESEGLSVTTGNFAGSGTEADPWRIATAEQLSYLRYYIGYDYRNAHFILENDIDLDVSPFNEGAGWEPIGSGTEDFYGSLKGNGKIISGLYINRPSEDGVGLFSHVKDSAMLTGIRLVDVDVAGRKYVGGLAGDNRGSITDSSVTGVIRGAVPAGEYFSYTGGLAGNNAGVIERSYADANVTSTVADVGGLVGANSGGEIIDSYATGSVSGTGNLGGLVGWNYGPVTNCYAAGTVTGEPDSSGGLVGVLTIGNVTSGYYDSTGGWADTGKGEPKSPSAMKQQATFVGWDFTPVTGVWRITENHTYPVLAWQPTTPAEITAEIALDLAEIAITYGAGDSASGVTQNLSLPISGNRDTSITWSSSDPSVISGAGTVTRPIFGDREVTLTATASKDGGVTQTRDFVLTVLQIAKAVNPSVPGAPELQGKTHNSVTLVANTAYEYRWNNGDWQVSNVFEGLMPSTAYSFTARFKETETYYASAEGPACTVETDPAPEMGGTVSITGTARFGVELGVDTSGVTYTPHVLDNLLAYQWSRSGSPIEGAVDSTYTPAVEDIGNTITVTVTADGQQAAGSLTSDPTGIIGKGLRPVPEAPSLQRKTFKSVSLVENPDLEFRMDGGGWQDSSVFAGLLPETSYSFTARLKETATHEASGESGPSSITTYGLSQMGGSGTASDPWQIATPAQLALVRTNLDADYILVDDIDLSAYLSQEGPGYNGGRGFLPIGDSYNYGFTGTFDGDGYIIQNLTVHNDTLPYAGLFGNVKSGAQLRNIVLTNVTITSSTADANVGGLAGSNSGSVTNCGSSGSVISTTTPSGTTGGLLGYNDGSVAGSFSSGSVSGRRDVGGLIGYNNGPVADCYSRSGVTANSNASVGGLIGFNQTFSYSIVNCYSSGSVTGSAWSFGGLIGHNTGDPAVNSHYDRETSGRSDDATGGTPEYTADMKREATYTGWDFTEGTGVWRIIEDYTYPALRWQSETADEANAMIEMDFPSVEISYAPGDSAAGVTQNLTLLEAGAHGTTITWSSDFPATVATDGTVSRPGFEDLTVTLIATVSRPGGTDRTKSFVLVVLEVEKAAGPPAPPAPVLSSKTHHSVTLEPNDAHEFRMNGGAWQDGSTGGNVFTGLSHSTPYTFRARVKETLTHEASNESPELSVTTSGLPEMGGMLTINGDAKYGSTLTVNTSGVTYSPDVDDDEPRYQWSRGEDPIPGTTEPIDGATGLAYTLVADDIGKFVFFAVSADGVHATGSVTSATVGPVAKANGPSAPDPPELASKTYYSVTLEPNDDHEFRMNDGSWQDGSAGGNVFTGLTYSTTYTFRARVKETPTHEASGESQALSATTDGLPQLEGTVTISGDAVYGSTLTANTSGITYSPDADDDEPMYQWSRGDAPASEVKESIDGATGLEYTLVADDIGEFVFFTVSADGAHATGSITASTAAAASKRVLTIGGSFEAEDKTYNTDASATIVTNNLNLQGVIGSDLGAVALNAAASFSDENAGLNKTVRLDGSSLSGVAAQNYELSLDDAPTAVATISQKTLTVKGSFTVSDKFEDETVAATIKTNALQLDGVLGNDEVTLQPVAAFADPGVGEAKPVTLTAQSTLSGAQGNNYSLSLAGAPRATASINPLFGGEGTAAAPWEIGSIEALEAVRERMHPEAHFKLMDDLDLTEYLSSDGAGYAGGAGWLPIGDSGRPFVGSFDGAGNVIRGVTMDRPDSDYVGFFGRIGEGAVVSGLTLEDVDVAGRGYFSLAAGGLAGQNLGTVMACKTSGYVISDYVAGGLIGENRGRIADSMSSCEVESSSDLGGEAGGLSGYNIGTIERCYFAGKVTAKSAGGLVAVNYGVISNSYVTGSVEGEWTSGGLAYWNTDIGRISSSYFLGIVTDGWGASYGLVCLVDYGAVIESSYYCIPAGDDDTGVGQYVSLDAMKSRDTFSNWDFTPVTGTWRMFSGYTYPVLQWQDWTQAELDRIHDMLYEDEASLEIGYAAGDSASSVTRDLTLLPSGANGTPVTWSSSDTSVVSNTGTITRSPVDDSTAILTATVGHPGADSLTKTFTVTVKVLPIMGGSAGISGTPTYGTELTVVVDGLTYSTGNGEDNALSYRWKRDGQGIPGAVFAAYTLVADDVGSIVSVTVTADGDHAVGEVTAATATTVGKMVVTVSGSFAIVPKTYDKSVNATIATSDLLINGIIAGDEGAVNLSTGAVFSDPNAGSDKIVSLANCVLVGNAAPNYELLLVELPTILAGISQRELTVAGSFSAHDKIEDGKTVATINTNALVLVGVVEGDEVALSPVAAFSDAGVGQAKSVTLTDQSTLAGAQSSNYSLSLVGAPQTTANITRPQPVVPPSSGSAAGSSTQPSGATVDASGNITVVSTTRDEGTGILTTTQVDTTTLNTAFDRVTRDAQGKKTVEITLPEDSAATGYETVLPSEALTWSPNTQLSVKTGFAVVTLPGDMLGPQDAAGASSVSLTVGQGDVSSLDEEVRDQIGNRPVIQLTLSADGNRVSWDNPAAPVMVSVPYTPTAEELLDPEHIVVWYIDGAGNVVSVPDGRFDPATGTVVFTTTHFSRYAVAYVHKTFEDLNGVDWARKAIEVLASKGIVNGTSHTSYSPESNITRADFMMLLVRTLGLTAGVADNFDDVMPDAYYYEAVGIAKKLGIAKGHNNLFEPADSITRQDMMTLTARALTAFRGLKQATGLGVLDEFIDKDEVADYALQSMATLVAEGLVAGSQGTLNPGSLATRAEAAVFLYRIYNRF